MAHSMLNILLYLMLFVQVSMQIWLSDKKSWTRFITSLLVPHNAPGLGLLSRNKKIIIILRAFSYFSWKLPWFLCNFKLSVMLGASYHNVYFHSLSTSCVVRSCINYDRLKHMYITCIFFTLYFPESLVFLVDLRVVWVWASDQPQTCALSVPSYMLYYLWQSSHYHVQTHGWHQKANLRLFPMLLCIPLIQATGPMVKKYMHASMNVVDPNFIHNRITWSKMFVRVDFFAMIISITPPWLFRSSSIQWRTDCRGLCWEQYLLRCSGVSMHPVVTLPGNPQYSTNPACSAAQTSLLFFIFPSSTNTDPQPASLQRWASRIQRP